MKLNHLVTAKNTPQIGLSTVYLNDIDAELTKRLLIYDAFYLVFLECCVFAGPSGIVKMSHFLKREL